jgi:uncharacterized protein YndB with AHSA1/START domain
MAGDVVSEIYIQAPPATVFEYFVDAEKLCTWLSVDATLEPRPGGRCVQVHDGVDRGGGLCEMQGTFLEVEPPTRVVFTWGFDDPAVHVPPGSSVVEVTLEPVGRGTHVRLVHRGLPDDEIPEHDRGWRKMLTRLGQAAAPNSSIDERSILDGHDSS